MTDLEMTKLCAEAMGIPVKNSIHRGATFVEISTGRDPGNEGEYNPLHDDSQAMALVKSLHIQIMFLFPQERWYVECGSDHAGDTDLNRAIVQCVAKLQKEKSNVRQD